MAATLDAAVGECTSLIAGTTLSVDLQADDGLGGWATVLTAPTAVVAAGSFVLALDPLKLALITGQRLRLSVTAPANQGGEVSVEVRYHQTRGAGAAVSNSVILTPEQSLTLLGFLGSVETLTVAPAGVLDGLDLQKEDGVGGWVSCLDAVLQPGATGAFAGAVAVAQAAVASGRRLRIHMDAGSGEAAQISAQVRYQEYRGASPQTFVLGVLDREITVDAFAAYIAEASGAITVDLMADRGAGFVSILSAVINAVHADEGTTKTGSLNSSLTILPAGAVVAVRLTGAAGIGAEVDALLLSHVSANVTV
jgi:hypothetical protein